MTHSGKVTVLAAFPWPERGQLSEAQYAYLFHAAQKHGFRNPGAYQEWWERNYHKSSLDCALIPIFRRTLAGLAWKGLHPNESIFVELTVAYSCLEDWAGIGLAELVFVASENMRMGARLQLASMLINGEADAELEEKSADLLWSILRPGSELPSPPIEATLQASQRLEEGASSTSAAKAGPSNEQEDNAKSERSLGNNTASSSSSSLPKSDTTLNLGQDKALIRNKPELPPLPSPHAHDPTFEAGISFLDWRDPARTPPCLLETDECPIVRLTMYLPNDDNANVEQKAARERRVTRNRSFSSSTSIDASSEASDLPDSGGVHARAVPGTRYEDDEEAGGSGSQKSTPPLRSSPKRRLRAEMTDDEEEGRHDAGEGGKPVTSKRLRRHTQQERERSDDEQLSARNFPLLRLTCESRR
ncbi:hypothetical protein CF326_g3481 [Tilletia indica]|nr:hypothetical protein CF326_g3481 [Tilletia indica]